VQHQWHTMTKTGKIPTLNKLNPGTFVEINPQDAERLGVRSKDKIEIRNARGYAILPALVTDRIQPGCCFAPIHWNDVFGNNLCINAITSDKVDPISFQPELKVAAVKLTRIETIASDLIGEAENAPKIDLDENALLILWASQTGKAEALAEQLADTWMSQGWPVQIAAMNTYSVKNLARKKSVTFITSTFGDGDAPDNGGDFWSQLNDDKIPSIAHIEFSLLALGDSSYAQFCGHGKKLFARFQDLGATAILERVDCDLDYEKPAANWMKKLTQEIAPRLESYGVEVKTIDAVSNHSYYKKKSTNQSQQFTKTNPYQSRLAINTQLTAAASAKDVRHFGFDLTDSGIEYQVGDALGIWPKNCPDYVEELTHLLKLKSDAAVTVNEKNISLHQALIENVEICRPTQEAIKLIAERSQSDLLLGLLDSESKEELQNWLFGRQLADLLFEFPIQLTAEELLSVLKPIQPRLYSIASSQKVVGQRVDLTVSAVRYARFRDKKRIRKGVCSTFLADRAEQEKIPLFIQPSKHFHVPERGDIPIIMVGPGTGIAPFRGFLQERQARGDSGKNWLFFGEQHQATDFYFKDEIMQFKKDGLLTELSVAFSRDQQEKIYVQDRLRERAKDIWTWLEEGACFYVCGDASKMAKDVDTTLRAIIQEQGGFNEVETVNYIRKLNMDKRYLRDVY
jgi:sulfite reductase (NADPH) flavoprotein alpha-component